MDEPEGELFNVPVDMLGRPVMIHAVESALVISAHTLSIPFVRTMLFTNAFAL